MQVFRVGYAEVNINPPLGSMVCGYYIPRIGEGFLDDLQASALALSCDNNQIVLISVDSTELYVDACQRYALAIESVTGIPKENVFIAATHTHTAPLAGMTDIYEVNEEEIRQYADFLQSRLIDAVRMAIADLKNAKMGYIVGYAPERVAYIRRYKMKDGKGSAKNWA